MQERRNADLGESFSLYGKRLIYNAKKLEGAQVPLIYRGYAVMLLSRYVFCQLRGNAAWIKGRVPHIHCPPGEDLNDRHHGQIPMLHWAYRSLLNEKGHV